MTSALWLLPLALIGLLDSIYIAALKKRASSACSLGGQCHTVLHSKYNKLFGVSNEHAGAFYYIVLFILAIIALLQNSSPQEFLFFSIGLLTVMGMLVSFIFIGIQAFILHKWCQYCLIASGVNIALFFAAARTALFV